MAGECRGGGNDGLFHVASSVGPRFFLRKAFAMGLLHAQTLFLFWFVECKTLRDLPGCGISTRWHFLDALSCRQDADSVREMFKIFGLFVDFFAVLRVTLFGG